MTYTETIESLRCCFGFGTCSECKVKSMMEEDPLPCKLDCKDQLGLYAADLIERLTAENAKAEAERDALIEQIKSRHDCLDCKNDDYCDFDNANVIDCMNCVKGNCPCAKCCDSSRWEWRGLPEAPEKGDT